MELPNGVVVKTVKDLRDSLKGISSQMDISGANGKPLSFGTEMNLKTKRPTITLSVD
jgi:hypothetical protein